MGQLPLRCILAFGLLAWVVVEARPGRAQTVDVREIGPQQSSLHPADPDGASGGRVNGLAVARANPRIMFAASEWGGLFQSNDAGQNWQHVPGHVPVATWDVKIDPTDPNRVYATSFYDGRVQSRAGVGISTDGGRTWTRAATTVPPANFCEDEVRREEPSAFGIAFDPANPANVFTGTNCGLAMSRDRGATWTFVDPVADGVGASDIWSVIVHHGVIDVCGDGGHRRSTDNGVTWRGATGLAQLPEGRCSLAASPDEAHVLFAVVGVTIHETNDGGQTWRPAYGNPSPQGRIPFIAVNKRAGPVYDLWFGDVGLHRRSCTTPQPPNAGGTSRCQGSSWAGPFTRQAGGHDDVGHILFDPVATRDACPILFSSDGGVYLNTKTTSPECHDPAWTQPSRTPRALWNWDLTGVHLPGTEGERLYFGSQDTGTFGTSNGGSDTPTWANQHCCDGFNVAADEDRVLTTVCCWSPGRATRLWVSAPGLAGPSNEINTYPPGDLRRFEQLDNMVAFGRSQYVVVTMDGVFITTNVAANSIIWTQLGPGSTPPNPCGIQVARKSANSAPTFFVKSGGCDGETGGRLWRYDGVAASGSWKLVSRQGAGHFGVYAVDPQNPDRIVAADLGGTSGPDMVLTSDGGGTWTSLVRLNALMRGNGVFRSVTRRGPLRWTNFGAYPQPTLVAFQPRASNILVAAGADSGVFLSQDGGANWVLLTDPDDPGRSGRAHIPRARYVHFDQDEPDALRMYVGTQGRGVWRIRIGAPPAAAVEASTPPPVLPPPSAVPQPDIAAPKR
jgi:hypothetical protein